MNEQAISIGKAMQIALEFHQQNQPGKAEAIYRQVLLHEPANPDALHLLGLIAQDAGDHDQSIDLIRRAIALRPRWPEALYNLGNSLRASGEFDRAAEAFSASVALRPNWAEALCNLGSVLKDQGKMRLFRQPSAGDWKTVMLEVRKALEQNALL